MKNLRALSDRQLLPYSKRMQFLLSRRFLALPVGLLLIVAAVVAALYAPRATVIVHPRTNERTFTQDIWLSAGREQPDFSQYALPARVVERTAEDELRAERTGGQSDDFARGSIVLINDGDSEQPLLPKSHLKHEATGRYFLTDTPITLPPHSRLKMTITAKEKGRAGNVSPGRFIVEKLPASLQTVVWGESQDPLAGGIRVDEPLAEAELAETREKLFSSLRDRLQGELTAEVGGAAIHPDLFFASIEEEAETAGVGSMASEYQVRLRVRGRAFVVDETDLLNMTLLALRARATPEEEFVAYAPGSFRMSVATLDFEKREARLQGTLTGTFARKLPPTVLRPYNLAGLNENEVREYFQRYEAVGDVEVVFFPFWVRTVPGRSSAVQIAIKGLNNH